MTHFNGIPDAYTTRWNTHSTPINSSASRSPSTQTRKYNTSCDRCRKSRVKCSGGVPCRRCASSSASPCVYSVSQRRGKKRACTSSVLSASNGLPSLEVTPSDLDIAAFDLELAPTVEPQNIDPNLFNDLLGLDQPLPGQGAGVMSGTLGSANSPSLTEIVDTLDSEPPSFCLKPISKCPKACYADIHDMSGIVDTMTKNPGQTPLEEILSLFQTAFHQSAQYLACQNCDTGCLRYINLVILHQRQTNLLSELAEEPRQYLRSDMVSTTLGGFQPSKQDDIAIKHLMVRQATRDVIFSVNTDHESATGFQQRYTAGTLDLSDTGKLNVKWLVEVSENLQRTLEHVRVLLEKDDWAQPSCETNKTV
ncbi:hypothetical protein FNAPI_13570 [Fusarium napiforme]|uniref:Zn(2)-C6 fungal-type domain-containing protein n=1 Tax=Fusarium napiforme TaxID=42672 RepID=A0A8H5MJN1_9HYPO|nr:hypothetical protein FNAPI_13570 [Fusarium napiforme]